MWANCHDKTGFTRVLYFCGWSYGGSQSTASHYENYQDATGEGSFDVPASGDNGWTFDGTTTEDNGQESEGNASAGFSMSSGGSGSGSGSYSDSQTLIDGAWSGSPVASSSGTEEDYYDYHEFDDFESPYSGTTLTTDVAPDVTQNISATATGTADPIVTITGSSSGLCNQIVDYTDDQNAANSYETTHDNSWVPADSGEGITLTTAFSASGGDNSGYEDDPSTSSTAPADSFSLDNWLIANGSGVTTRGLVSYIITSNARTHKCARRDITDIILKINISDVRAP